MRRSRRMGWRRRSGSRFGVCFVDWRWGVKILWGMGSDIASIADCIAERAWDR
jgi:hypothetical protein